MTNEEYYGEVRRLGLERTKVPNVYLSLSGDMHNVPDGNKQTSAQREETIDRLKILLGIGKREDG